MKKTGKVLSLVLSLALVASSLTATFASAASKSGTATVANDTIYLSNGDVLTGNIDADIVAKSIKVGVTTIKSADLGNFAVTDVASSNSAIASVKKTGSSYSLKLANSTITGTFTVSVRYAGKVQFDGENDTQVYATSKITYTVLKKGTAYVLGATETAAGVKPDALANLSKTVGSTEDGKVYVVEQDADLKAKFAPKTVTTDESIDGYKVSSSNVSGVVVSTTGAGTAFTLTTASTTTYAPVKSYTISAQNYTSGSAVKSDKASTVISVENRVKAKDNYDTISSYSNVTYLYTDTVTKDNVATAKKAGEAQVVTGSDVDLSCDTTIESGSVGTVAGSYLYTISGGTTAKSTATSTVVNGGTVKAISGTSATITSGSVGTVSAVNTFITSADEKAVTVGDVTIADGTPSSTLDITSVDGYAVKTGTITAADDATIALSGDAVTCGQIDAANYDVVIDMNAFKGTIAAPKNAYQEDLYGDTTGIELNVNDKSDATVTGDAIVPTLNVIGTVSFPGSLNVGSTGVDGTGTLCIVPGKFFSNGPVTTVNMKLLKTANVGDTVFTATTDLVDVNAFTPVGYTLEVTSGTKVDTFKVTEKTFAGLTISGPATFAQKTSATYTASTYPDGTALPTGYSIEWSFDGDDTIFSYKADGNKLTVTAGAYDDTFASVNKATLTATVLDENGDDASDTYPAATYDIAITKAATYTSDTTGTLNLAVGQTYQFKITSSDGSVPPFTVANGGATVAAYTKSGNDYFFKVTGAKAGEYGVYVGGKVCTLNVTAASTAVKTDTTKVTIANGKTYQFKITASAKPTFVVASVGAILPASVNGNDYFYKVTNNGMSGDYGVYVNGAKIAVITFTK